MIFEAFLLQYSELTSVYSSAVERWVTWCYLPMAAIVDYALHEYRISSFFFLPLRMGMEPKALHMLSEGSTELYPHYLR